MTELRKIDLSTSHKVDLAVLSIATQGDYGSICALSREFGVSRPTIYDVKQTTSELLERHFDDANEATGAKHVIIVDDAQLRRAIVALRRSGPNALRPIENLLSILYPGLHVSYGKIQGILVEAEKRARLFNEKVDLSAIISGAVDEMYSQGAPVLAGVDLVSGYLSQTPWCVERGHEALRQSARVPRSFQASDASSPGSHGGGRSTRRHAPLGGLDSTRH